VTSNLPTVSVIIPALNAAEALPTALDSVTKQSYENIVDVVVAAGDDDTALAAQGRAKVVRNPALRTSTALNLAIAASNGEVIVRCDAHARLPADYVETAVETLFRTGAEVVGGMQVPVGETKWQRGIASAMSSFLGAGGARYRTGGEEGPVETVYLGVFRREAIDRVGGFDDHFIRNQDYELNHRIIESGGTVWFNPALRVEYRPRSSLTSLARQYFEYGRAKRRFSRKHPGSLRWRQLLPPALVVGLGAAVVVSFWWSPALLLLILYGGSMLGAGVSARAGAWRVAIALITMHLSWGTGFLTGATRS
jgi:glycosyltransferase involved in cell wall biosynthesis